MLRGPLPPPDRSSRAGPTRKVALVARGETRLGRALTVGLADAGYDLAVLAPGTTAEDARMEDRVVRSGRRIRLLDTGLRGPGDPNRIVHEVERGFGRLDAVIAFPTAPPARDTSDPSALLAEPFHLVRRCAGSLRDTRGAVVVCLGDAADEVAGPLQALTRALARVLAPHVRVNAVAPAPRGGPSPPEADWIRAVLFVLASPHLGGEVLRVGDGDGAG